MNKIQPHQILQINATAIMGLLILLSFQGMAISSLPHALDPMGQLMIKESATQKIIDECKTIMDEVLVESKYLKEVCMRKTIELFEIEAEMEAMKEFSTTPKEYYPLDFRFILSTAFQNYLFFFPIILFSLSSSMVIKLLVTKDDDEEQTEAKNKKSVRKALQIMKMGFASIIGVIGLIIMIQIFFTASSIFGQ